MSQRGWVREKVALTILGMAALLPWNARAQAAVAGSTLPGALIRMDLLTTVGVQLDEPPAGPAREAAANWALAKGEDFWEKRASEQVNLTYYRLAFRSFFYAPPPVRGDLPFPPHAAWRFEILDEPRRMQIGTHDYVAVPYHFWPLRDCGFTPPSKVYSCAAGSMVKLSCKTSGSKQVLRVCGIPCTYLNSASNTIIDGDCETVTFSCPAVRDTAVAGTGAYPLSQAPLLPSDPSDAVSCTQN
jgi:hypothetical protein